MAAGTVGHDVTSVRRLPCSLQLADLPAECPVETCRPVGHQTALLKSFGSLLLNMPVTKRVKPEGSELPSGNILNTVFAHGRNSTFRYSTHKKICNYLNYLSCMFLICSDNILKALAQSYRGQGTHAERGVTMAETTAIEWTNATWNPVTGCTKISAGCDNCYAERFSERFRGVADHPFEMGFDLTLRPARLEQPLRWRQPRMIFVNSMSDLFHKLVPFDFVDRVFDTMDAADWHTFQVLTKRSSRMRDYIIRRYGDKGSPAHVWLGVSVEDGTKLSRVRQLAQAPIPVRFLSVEPLIGPIGKLPLTGIGWVIVGGESGPRARPMDEQWVRDVRDQCTDAGVPFFFKQWGEQERAAALQTLLSNIPQAPSFGTYGDARAAALTNHVVRVADVNRLAATLRKEGRLLFADWPARKQVPEPEYQVQRVGGGLLDF